MWEGNAVEFLKDQHYSSLWKAAQRKVAEAEETNAVSISPRNMYLPVPSLKVMSLITASVVEHQDYSTNLVV